MSDFQPEYEYPTVVLAALLHDIAKISQRESGEYYSKQAEFSENFIDSVKIFFGEDYAREIASLIEKSQETPSARDEYILYISDKLAAAEGFREGKRRFKSNEAPLIPVTSRIKFRKDWDREKYYRLSTLRIEENLLFPLDEPSVESGAYIKIWDRFVEKIELLGKYQASDFVTLFYILKEVGSYVPSATPWEKEGYNTTVPDVSLFDHSKVTCSIAACLKQMSKEDLSDNEMEEIFKTLRKYHDEGNSNSKEEVVNSSGIMSKELFLLLRADIAGIQKFIYGIIKPKLETKGTSKRLRGRSFYVSLLTDVISDWVIRRMHLAVSNILFCGGGRFDILLTNNEETHSELKKLGKELDEWLLDEFYGELSIQIASVKIAPKDFINFDIVFRNLEDKLNKTKAKKFVGVISQPDFFKPTKQFLDLCGSCHLTPISKDEECHHCRTQRDIIGSNLPKKDFITFVYGKYEGPIGAVIPFDKFGVTISLQDQNEMNDFLKEKNPTEVHVFRINPEFSEKAGLDFFPKDGREKPICFGFKFLGNSAPIGTDGDVLEFDEIANLSTGAKYLGILKMDVDYLGMMLALGIAPLSISRFSTLSSNLEIFFGVWLNKVCERLGNVFYTVYSGGDDLFIIGPWDQTIELGWEIYSDFRKYTGQNPNVTLSSGILFVKPHFPIHRFAQLVTKELDKSKDDADKQNERGLKEKNRVTLFGETVQWVNGDKSFKELLEFAKKLVDLVQKEEKVLPKGLIYFFGRLERYFYEKGSLMWVPNLFYSLARRVKREDVRKELASKLPFIMGKIKIPVSYVSLKTRKE